MIKLPATYDPREQAGMRHVLPDALVTHVPGELLTAARSPNAAPAVRLGSPSKCPRVALLATDRRKR